MRQGKVQVGDYVYVSYMRRYGKVVDDRGGHVGRWKIYLDDGGICHASSRDLITEEQSQAQAEEEIDNLVEKIVDDKIQPIDWEQQSKDSMARILKKYNSGGM